MNPKPLLLLLIFPQFAGTLGARSAGLEPATFSVRSHSPSGTRADTEGQGETKQRFYQVLALLRDRGRHPIAVKTRVVGGQRRDLEREKTSRIVALLGGSTRHRERVQRL